MFPGLLSNKEDRKGLDESLDTDSGGCVMEEMEQAMNSDSSASDCKNTKTSRDFSSTRSVKFNIELIIEVYCEEACS